MLLLSVFAVSALFADQVTIYNDNFSLVRTSLELDLQKGMQNIFIDDIPSTIEANSVIIKPVDGNVGIFSQNYEYDLANTEQILRKYIGKKVEIIAKNDQLFSGILQFNDHNMIGILDGSTKKLTLLRFDEIRNINLAELPANFFLKPTLNWKLNADQSGKHKLDFSYLCYGMQWDVTYNCVWNADKENLEINSWVTITNETGKAFTDTKLKLLAGDVAKEQQYGAVSKTSSGRTLSTYDNLPEFQEKAFHDFHLYTLSDNVSINNNQTKQLRLFPVKSIIAHPKYIYQTLSDVISSNIEFINSKKNGVGIPLPKGIVKIYKLDTADDQLEFIGEDRIDHTPVDEKVLITTGKAFDLTGTTTLMDKRQIVNRIYEKDLKVTLKNHSQETKEITVLHRIVGIWTISNANLNYTKKSANEIEFSKSLASGEEFELIWTERTE